MSWPAQQAPERRTAAPWSYSCRVTPTTSAPVCAASAAVTELSTPPDMATTILASLAGRARSKLGGIAWLFTRISLLTARGSGGRGFRGKGLARHEPEFRAATEGPLSLAELIALLGDAKALTERDRQEAI